MLTEHLQNKVCQTGRKAKLSYMLLRKMYLKYRSHRLK